MNPALLQKSSNSFRTDSEIKDHGGLNVIVCVPCSSVIPYLCSYV